MYSFMKDQFLVIQIYSHYLDPWCMNPKQSRAFEDILKYLPVKAPLCSKRIIFSTNLYTAKNTPAPCRIKIGEKRTIIGMCLAEGGVPWN